MRINYYSSLNSGGTKNWILELEKQAKKSGLKTNLYQSFFTLFLQPFLIGICHTTLPFPYKPLFGKYILSVHGNFFMGTDRWSKQYPNAILACNQLTLPSQFLKDDLTSWIDQNYIQKNIDIKYWTKISAKIHNATIIPNGIVLSKDRKENYEFIEANTINLGILTNFNFPEKIKGLAELIKILDNIASEDLKEIKILLHVGGDGKDYSEFKNKLKTNSKNLEIKFLGYTDPIKLFKKIDIFTYYSFMDNQPFALIEAMNYGLPVISNPIGAVPELFGEDLRDNLAKDQDHYQKRLLALIDNSQDRKNNALRARYIIEKKYNWPIIWPDFEKIYSS